MARSALVERSVAMLRWPTFHDFIHGRNDREICMRCFLASVIVLAGSAGLFAADAKQAAPTHANVSYGPHPRNVLDFWQAEGNGPRPLLVYIHGGGWVGGDKNQ